MGYTRRPYSVIRDETAHEHKQILNTGMKDGGIKYGKAGVLFEMLLEHVDVVGAWGIVQWPSSRNESYRCDAW